MLKHHFVTELCDTNKFDVSVVMSSRSVLSFFKKPVDTVNNSSEDVVNIPESSCTVLNIDVNSENVSSGTNYFLLPE